MVKVSSTRRQRRYHNNPLKCSCGDFSLYKELPASNFGHFLAPTSLVEHIDSFQLSWSCSTMVKEKVAGSQVVVVVEQVKCWWRSLSSQHLQKCCRRRFHFKTSLSFHGFWQLRGSLWFVAVKSGAFLSSSSIVVMGGSCRPLIFFNFLLQLNGLSEPWLSDELKRSKIPRISFY